MPRRDLVDKVREHRLSKRQAPALPLAPTNARPSLKTAVGGAFSAREVPSRHAIQSQSACRRRAALIERSKPGADAPAAQLKPRWPVVPVAHAAPREEPALGAVRQAAACAGGAGTPARVGPRRAGRNSRCATNWPAARIPPARRPRSHCAGRRCRCCRNRWNKSWRCGRVWPQEHAVAEVPLTASPTMLLQLGRVGLDSPRPESRGASGYEMKAA
jgi:hypothetical protein